MGRRRLLAFVVALAPLALAAACAFPDVTFAPADANDAGAEGGHAADAAAGDAPSEGSLPGDVDPDGHLADASTDDASAVDAAGCTSCDCDGDGFERLEPDAGCEGTAGPVDCDDTIKAINPGQGFVLNATWPSKVHGVPFDWDCSGAVTKQFPYNGTCQAFSSCSNGFVGNPPCGGTAEFLMCQQPLPILGATCSVAASEAYGVFVQGCR